MIWVFFIAVAVALVAGFGALLTGRLGVDPVPDPVASAPDSGLPADFAAADVDEVRFDTALRGYRMDQVDDVLDRLARRIHELEREATSTTAPAEPVDR